MSPARSGPAPELPTKLTVDFTGVEDRQGGPPAAHVPAGDYLLVVEKAEVRIKNSDKDKPPAQQSRYINWQLKIVKGAGRGTVYHVTSLKQESLWSLRSFLGDLLNRVIPQKAVGVDLPAYVGKQIGATLDDDDPFTKTDEGTGISKTTIKSRVVATFPAGEYPENADDAGDGEESADDEDEAEEEEAAPAKAAPKAKAGTKKQAAAVAEAQSDEDLEELEVEDL